MMKKILYLLLAFTCSSVSAQIIDIPNPAFKTRLLNQYDTTAKNQNGGVILIDSNNDGEIQVSEAEAVWSLDISGNVLTDIDGIEYFTNLRKFVNNYASYLQEMDLTALVNLEELSFHNSGDLNSVNIEGLVNLEIIDASSCYTLIGLNCEGFSALTDLTIEYSADIEELNLTGAVNLVNLNCRHTNNLEVLDCSTLTSLYFLDIVDSSISDLNVANLPNLNKINALSAYALHSVDLTGLNNLEQIDLKSSGIQTISIDLPNLESINLLLCDNLDEVIITNAPSLTAISISGFDTDLTNLDLSNCPALDIISLDLDNLEHLNLKNGDNNYISSAYVSFSINNDDDLPCYICIDEGEEIYFTSAINNNPNITLNTYCPFFESEFNTITGTINFDMGNDGCADDIPSGFMKVVLNDGSETGAVFNDSEGNYAFNIQTGTFSITPQFENDWFTATPATVNITSDVIDGTVTIQDFCVTANGIHPDIEVVIIPIEVAQPGFDADYKIVYKNNGNQELSGSIILSYNDILIDYVYALPVENQNQEGQLYWDFESLHPFESREIAVTFNVNSPSETPAVNIGDVLEFSLTAINIQGDDSPEDNTAVEFNQTVIGSFDPNNIICLEGETVSDNLIGEYLHYNINFENTGTAAASFIVIKDTIDETQYDINTLEVLSASHSVVTKVEGQVVEFRFDDINLGPEEKGNVVIKLKTLNTLVIGDAVTNDAEIYFDYNLPIETNEAVTTFAVLGINDFSLQNIISLYPNPVKENLYISSVSSIKNVQVFDIQGRILQENILDSENVTINMSSRLRGIYIVRVTTADGVFSEKILIE